jgi:hypothetical protein
MPLAPDEVRGSGPNQNLALEVQENEEARHKDSTL